VVIKPCGAERLTIAIAAAVDAEPEAPPVGLERGVSARGLASQAASSRMSEIEIYLIVDDLSQIGDLMISNGRSGRLPCRSWSCTRSCETVSVTVAIQVPTRNDARGKSVPDCAGASTSSATLCRMRCGTVLVALFCRPARRIGRPRFQMRRSGGRRRPATAALLGAASDVEVLLVSQSVLHAAEIFTTAYD